MLVDPHADRELALFRDFALVCPLGIEMKSIEKRDPPEADILCRIADGSALAFEMVESTDGQPKRCIKGSSRRNKKEVKGRLDQCEVSTGEVCLAHITGLALIDY